MIDNNETNIPSWLNLHFVVGTVHSKVCELFMNCHEYFMKLHEMFVNSQSIFYEHTTS